MLSRRTPQNVLGTSQQQTSARPQPSSLSTNILQLHNGTLPQGVNIKLTDDCFQNLQKAAQNGLDVLVHVNRKSITIEIKTNNATSLKFDCYFQRVSGNVIHALCKSNNTFNDVANIAIRAQVKPTEQTFQTSRQKAATLSKHLELESNKCRTQMLPAPITKPGERISFKNKTTVNRVGIPKSIPNPPRNGSFSLGSSALTSSSSSSNLQSLTSNKLGSGGGNNVQRGPKDYAALKQQVIHYIACGRFITQDEIVDHIMSTGLPPGIPPESAKRKIREIICEVAEVYVNPPKIALLPQYHREININWEYFSAEDRERVRQALSQTEITAGNNFAPMRHSRRGPFVAPKSKTRKDPATPAMTNSTTTSPDIASDASTCSTPSPGNQMQIDNDYQITSKPEKRKLSSNDLSVKSTNSPLNNDDVPPPVKKRLTMNDSSSHPSSSKEVQPMIIESTTKSIPKSSSQSDFNKFKSSPYLKPASSPKIHQNGFKGNEKPEKSLNKEHHRSKESIPFDKNQLYNGFTKSKNNEKFAVNGNNFSKKSDQSFPKPNKATSIQERVSIKSEEIKRDKSHSTILTTTTPEAEKDDAFCEKTKVLMQFADESMKKLKEEKEKKKEKLKKEYEKIVAEEKFDKRDKSVENNITKLDANNGISTVEKKIKLEIKLEEQPKEKNKEKSEKEHRNHHHHKEKSKDKKDIKKSEMVISTIPTTTTTTAMTLKEDPFKEPSKIIKEEAGKESKKDKKSGEKQKERHNSSSNNGKMASDKESLKGDENGQTSSSEKPKKDKKKEKEHKKEHRSSKSESEIKATKEKKVKTEVPPPNSTKSNDTIVEKPKEKHKEKEKSKDKERTKEKLSKIKIEVPEKSKMSAKDAASLASEKLLLKPAEKLSKPVVRETPKPQPKEFKPLNPEKLTPDDIKKIKIQDLLKLLSDPLKPSKSYEEKYPPIRTPADAELMAKHEMEYYDLYEKAYNGLLNVQKDLSIYVERLNKAQTDQEKNKLEDKIRNYAARCLQDDNFRNQRRTVANMTKAIQVLRQRQDDYYGPEQNNP